MLINVLFLLSCKVIETGKFFVFSTLESATILYSRILLLLDLLGLTKSYSVFKRRLPSTVPADL
jgi:hypothetical protein